MTNVLTWDQLGRVVYGAGFRGQALAIGIAVAMAESGGDADAHNTNGEDSRGLFQINVGPGAHSELAGLDLFDPPTNAQQAYSISGGGSDWGPWTTYTGGRYLAYLDQAQTLGRTLDATGGQGPFTAGPNDPATSSGTTSNDGAAVAGSGRGWWLLALAVVAAAVLDDG